MDALAFSRRSEGQQYVSNSGIEKKDHQTGALAKAKESPGPRAQFSGAAISYPNAIENRNCKTSDSAVNDRITLGAFFLSHSIFAEIEGFDSINYSKVLSGINILKQLVGNNSEDIKSVLTWRRGGSSGKADENEFHRISMLDAFLNFEEVKRPLENRAELKEFYQTLCTVVKDHKTFLQQRL